MVYVPKQRTKRDHAKFRVSFPAQDTLRAMALLGLLEKHLSPSSPISTPGLHRTSGRRKWEALGLLKFESTTGTKDRLFGTRPDPSLPCPNLYQRAVRKPFPPAYYQGLAFFFPLHQGQPFMSRAKGGGGMLTS